MIPSKASENNSVWVYPITFGGGLVGGDGIQMEFRAKQNCCAVITGQESTKVSQIKMWKKVTNQVHVRRIDARSYWQIVIRSYIKLKQRLA